MAEAGSSSSKRQLDELCEEMCQGNPEKKQRVEVDKFFEKIDETLGPIKIGELVTVEELAQDWDEKRNRTEPLLGKILNTLFALEDAFLECPSCKKCETGYVIMQF
jgi:hypothetical protein